MFSQLRQAAALSRMDFFAHNRAAIESAILKSPVLPHPSRRIRVSGNRLRSNLRIILGGLNQPACDVEHFVTWYAS
jgi:hypothetical protein